MRASLRGLTVDQILAWADAHFAAHGRWPGADSGRIEAAHEGTWRGIKYLMDQSETGVMLKIKVLNCSKKEMLKDLQRAPEFDQSALFKKVYEEEYGIYGGRDGLAEIYDAFETPRADRGDLPFLRPEEAREYLAEVRSRTIEVIADRGIGEPRSSNHQCQRKCRPIEGARPGSIGGFAVAEGKEQQQGNPEAARELAKSGAEVGGEQDVAGEDCGAHSLHQRRSWVSPAPRV